MSDSFLIKIGILIALLTGPSWVQAWPAPVDMDADNIGSNNNNNTYTTSDGTTYDRCDAEDYVFNGTPSNCHRWGLVFQYYREHDEWVPEIPSDADGSEYRLPTIKELVRLYNYTDSSKGLDFVIQSWFTVSDENWLVSSSYRDIDRNYDGDDDSEFAQVFALNSASGEVRAFEPGSFALCEVLWSGQSNSSNRGRCTAGDMVTMHALKVNQTLLKDL